MAGSTNVENAAMAFIANTVWRALMNWLARPGSACSRVQTRPPPLTGIALLRRRAPTPAPDQLFTSGVCRAIGIAYRPRAWIVAQISDGRLGLNAIAFDSFAQIGLVRPSAE